MILIKLNAGIALIVIIETLPQEPGTDINETRDDIDSLHNANVNKPFDVELKFKYFLFSTMLPILSVTRHAEKS